MRANAPYYPPFWFRRPFKSTLRIWYVGSRNEGRENYANVPREGRRGIKMVSHGYIERTRLVFLTPRSFVGIIGNSREFAKATRPRSSRWDARNQRREEPARVISTRLSHRSRHTRTYGVMGKIVVSGKCDLGDLENLPFRGCLAIVFHLFSFLFLQSRPDRENTRASRPLFATSRTGWRCCGIDVRIIYVTYNNIIYIYVMYNEDLYKILPTKKTRPALCAPPELHESLGYVCVWGGGGVRA